MIKNVKLANTFKVIAEEGSDSIYGGGSLAQNIVDEIQEAGGIISMEDLTSFQPKWGKPIESKLFNNESLFTFPLPATGHIITYILNILNGYNFQDHSLEYHNDDKLFYHRIIEAFKYGFAQRAKIGDEMSEDVLRTLMELESAEFAEGIRQLITDDTTFDDFTHYGANASITLDHGTGHISILAPNGDAVALTATINVM